MKNTCVGVEKSGNWAIREGVSSFWGRFGTIETKTGVIRNEESGVRTREYSSLLVKAGNQ